MSRNALIVATLTGSLVLGAHAAVAQDNAEIRARTRTPRWRHSMRTFPEPRRLAPSPCDPRLSRGHEGGIGGRRPVRRRGADEGREGRRLLQHQRRIVRLSIRRPEIRLRDVPHERHCGAGARQGGGIRGRRRAQHRGGGRGLCEVDHDDQTSRTTSTPLSSARRASWPGSGCRATRSRRTTRSSKHRKESPPI